MPDQCAREERTTEASGETTVGFSPLTFDQCTYTKGGWVIDQWTENTTEYWRGMRVDSVSPFFRSLRPL